MAGPPCKKPDLTAADGVFTEIQGCRFFGSSASHAAGIPALVKSANQFLTDTRVRQIMADTALDAMEPGADRDAGLRITMAAAAAQAAMSPAP